MERLPSGCLPREGFLDEWLRVTRHVLDAPLPFLLVAGLATLATAIARRAFLPHGPQPIYPNLYVCLVAPPARHQKSLLLDVVKRLLADFEDRLLLPAQMTPEALLTVLKDQPQSLWVLSEFDDLLTATQREYMRGMPPLLADLYSWDGAFTRRLKEEEITVTDPCLSILGAITPRRLQDHARTLGFEQGFLSRVVWVYADEGRPLRAKLPTLEDHELNALRKSLRVCQERGGALDPGRGWSLFEHQFHAWAEQMEAPNASDALKAFLGRAPLLAQKFAMLYHVSASLEPIIAEEAWRHALTLTGWVVDRTARALAEEIPESEFHALVQKVLRRITRGGEITARELMQVMHVRRRDLDEVMDYLKGAGEVEVLGRGTTGDPRRYRRASRAPEG